MRDLAAWPMVFLTGCFSLSKSNATTNNQNGGCLAETVYQPPPPLRTGRGGNLAFAKIKRTEPKD